MTDNLGEILLIVLGCIGGLAGLLVVMTLLEPAKTRGVAPQVTSHAPRRR